MTKRRDSERQNPTLYELGGIDDVRYSQFSWRTRMALAHKGLEFDTVAVRVSDKAAIAFSDQDKVPILKDRRSRRFRFLGNRRISRKALSGSPVTVWWRRSVGLHALHQYLARPAAGAKVVPSMLMRDVLGIVDARGRCAPA